MKIRLPQFAALCLFFNLLLFVSPQSATLTSAQSAGTTTRVSVASDGTEGNSLSRNHSLSTDGRYVAFWSQASNLVNGDTNGTGDVFVHNRQTRQTTRVSVASDGTQGDNGSFSIFSLSLSADGRYVAFESSATNLVSGDTNGTLDVFVHDRQTGQTTRVSVASDGTQGNNESHSSSLSSDGRYVAFWSRASNLVSDDTNNYVDVFVHDRQSGQTTRVSVASNGMQGNDDSASPSISADGRYVAFWSGADNLVGTDTNGHFEDVFIHDRQTGQTTLVSVASNGMQGNSESSGSSLSADGRYVAFSSEASNLISGDTNGTLDVFVHDRLTGQTTRVSVASDNAQGDHPSYYASISADGRYVAFESWASNLVNDDTNGTYDIFVRDRQTGQTTRISVASDGMQANNLSYADGTSYISADGRYVAFYSTASNLVDGDTNGTGDIFVRDRQGTPTYAISGHVTEPGGTPLSGVIISDGAWHSPPTDANGDYTLPGLPAGTYTITPSKNDYTFSPPSRSITVGPTKSQQNFIAIPNLPPSSVPFFSQRDPAWIDHPLRTSGQCSAYCSKIGTCGCTLTSSAMVFNYYGANLTPPQLSDCMGTSACFYNWGVGASCTNGKATFVNRYAFSWSRLDQELNQNHRPVILGMHKKGDESNTHWVVVTKGQGTNPSDYEMHDPWFLGGANMKLSTRAQTHDFVFLSVYRGTPVSNASAPINRANNSVQASTPSSSNTIVSGRAMIFRLDDDTMTVQLDAESSAGNITEMLVWTDTNPDATWQPFATLTSLPFSENVYARFRDDQGNESGESSDRAFPVHSPDACITKPPKPTLTKPTDGSTPKKKKVKLNWEDTSCAEKYNVIVREGSRNGPKIQGKKRLVVSEFKTKRLTSGTTYFWRVTAINANGRSQSDWWSFTVE